MPRIATPSNSLAVPTSPFVPCTFLPPSSVTGNPQQLCYDVANAKTVTLDPPAGEVWPSTNRCLDISPKKTTTYTLTIVDSSGKSASQTVELQVR